VALGRDGGLLFQVRALFGLVLAAPCPSARATRSTSTWLTRLDLPEPETPVTAVITPSGNSAAKLVQVVAGDAFQAQPAVGSRGVRSVGHGVLRIVEQVAPRVRAATALQALGRPL
jgi:hypothetical protein